MPVDFPDITVEQGEAALILHSEKPLHTLSWAFEPDADCASFGLPEHVRIATRKPDDNAKLLAAIAHDR